MKAAANSVQSDKSEAATGFTGNEGSGEMAAQDLINITALQCPVSMPLLRIDKEDLFFESGAAQGVAT